MHFEVILAKILCTNKTFFDVESLFPIVTVTQKIVLNWWCTEMESDR